MADEKQQQNNSKGAPKKNKRITMVLFLVIGLASAGGGFAVPLLMPAMVGGAAQPPTPPLVRADGKPVFVTFDQLVVNLNSDRFNRYLKLAISLQIDESQQELVNQRIAAKKVRLKSWLISYLSDKQMEEVRGAAGQNRLRREIQDYFNAELFDDGYDRIHDILFEEFNVQ